MSYSSPQSGVRYGFESTYGTPATSYIFPCYNAEVSFTKNKRVEEITRVGSLIIEDQSPILMWDNSGNITGWLSNPWFLKCLYNTPTPSGSGPYTYSYTILRHTAQSITIDSHYGRLVGCILTGFTVSARYGERCTLTLPFISGHPPVSITIAGIIPDSNVDYPFIYYNGSVSGTYTYGSIREFSLTVDNTAEIIRRIGQLNPADAVYTKHSVTIDFTVLFSSTTLLNEFINDVRGTGSSVITLQLDNGATGTAQRRISFQVYGPYTIQNWSYNNAPNALIEARFTVKGSILQVQAINNRNTHP